MRYSGNVAAIQQEEEEGNQPVGLEFRRAIASINLPHDDWKAESDEANGGEIPGSNYA